MLSFRMLSLNFTLTLQAKKEQKEDILLFVREQKDDSYGSVPFMFLGKAKYVSHQGDKPMSIVWKLENKIPAKFIDVTDKLGIG